MGVALGEMNMLDLAVVAVYFISIIGVGVLVCYLCIQNLKIFLKNLNFVNL